MHHKFVVIDFSKDSEIIGKEGVVANGSINYTAKGRESNDENIILMKARNVVDAFATEFQEMWQSDRNFVSM